MASPWPLCMEGKSGWRGDAKNKIIEINKIGCKPQNNPNRMREGRWKKCRCRDDSGHYANVLTKCSITAGNIFPASHSCSHIVLIRYTMAENGVEKLEGWGV